MTDEQHETIAGHVWKVPMHHFSNIFVPSTIAEVVNISDNFSAFQVQCNELKWGKLAVLSTTLSLTILVSFSIMCVLITLLLCSLKVKC